MNKNFDGDWEVRVLALDTLPFDCLCGMECESSQDADKPGETVCILVGEDVRETSCGYSKDVYSLSGFILHGTKFIAQLLTHEASCAFDVE